MQTDPYYEQNLLKLAQRDLARSSEMDQIELKASVLLFLVLVNWQKSMLEILNFRNCYTK